MLAQGRGRWSVAQKPKFILLANPLSFPRCPITLSRVGRLLSCRARVSISTICNLPGFITDMFSLKGQPHLECQWPWLKKRRWGWNGHHQQMSQRGKSNTRWEVYKGHWLQVERNTLADDLYQLIIVKYDDWLHFCLLSLSLLLSSLHSAGWFAAVLLFWLPLPLLFPLLSSSSSSSSSSTIIIIIIIIFITLSWIVSWSPTLRTSFRRPWP